MGENTTYKHFYKPAFGASGATEMDLFHAKLDETDILLQFGTSVTTKTTTTDLTVAEAGTILVSAASAYTITLPTAVGNAGLTYNFVKTDANYNCITLDGDGTETLNYPCDAGTPQLTYARLNTLGAKVSIVSDNSNWIVTKEDLGQVPQGKVYLYASQLDITSGREIFVDVDTVVYDVGSNINVGTWVSGNATSTSAGHLVDSGGAFTSDMVDHRVKNTTDTTYTYITAVNSATDVTVRDDIFIDTEGYEIKHAKYVAPISGKYFVQALVKYLNTSVVADKTYGAQTYKNTTRIVSVNMNSSGALWLTCYAAGEASITKDENIFLRCYTNAGVDTVDILGQTEGDTWLQIRLISKE